MSDRERMCKGCRGRGRSRFTLIHTFEGAMFVLDEAVINRVPPLLTKSRMLVPTVAVPADACSIVLLFPMVEEEEEEEEPGRGRLRVC